MNATIAAVDSVKAVGGVAAGAARIQGAAPSAAGAAAADAAGLRKGFKGLPLIAHNLVPLDARDITLEHAKKYTIKHLCSILGESTFGTKVPLQQKIPTGTQ